MIPLLILALLAPAHAGKKKSEPPPLDEVAARLVGEALLADDAWEELVELADDIGPRPAGSPNLDEAIAWGLRHMEADGLEQVRAEVLTLPVWHRGHTEGGLGPRAAAVRSRSSPLGMPLP